MRRMNNLNRRIGVTSILVLVSALAVAQSPLSFFPHHLGDVWEYTGGNPPVITQERITRDSLGADGRYYLYHTNYGTMIVDTLALRILLPPNQERDTATYYRLDAHFGDTWIVARYPRGPVLATVRGEFQTILFGQLIDVKMIEFSDSASGLLAFPTDYLGRGYGLIGQDIDTFPDRRLTGAIINGVQYGKITLNVRQDHSLATSFNLHQNYPNPFNPNTTIHYELEQGDFVELKVFDVLGKEIAKLYFDFQDAGSHKIEFDGGDLASGTYIYMLKTRCGAMSKRMLLLK